MFCPAGTNIHSLLSRRDYSSVEKPILTSTLHPVGMQPFADDVASLRDAGIGGGIPFLPSYNPYGIKHRLRNNST
ncbi:hypothetical protein [Candidatus Symbiothrix dinenymphae]|uniref:hypothetical protein n=1 Tax=Candidatus Symbiothrix dinenymphae TaxID=467085 RepID=UPI001315918D|nr:hypothetical protein [Candidatus Symbiothrix dinenymphae]